MERTHQVSHIRKCFGQLARLRKLRDVLPASLKKRIYNALVLLHLDYCSVVWQECTKSLQLRVEQIQNHGMRFIWSKPYRAPSEEMWKSLKFTTLAVKCKRFRLEMVHRCLYGPSPKALLGLFVRNKEMRYNNTRGAESSTSSQTRLNGVGGHLQPEGHGSGISCPERPDRPTPHGPLKGFSIDCT